MSIMNEERRNTRGFLDGPERLKNPVGFAESYFIRKSSLNRFERLCQLGCPIQSLEKSGRGFRCCLTSPPVWREDFNHGIESALEWELLDKIEDHMKHWLKAVYDLDDAPFEEEVKLYRWACVVALAEFGLLYRKRLVNYEYEMADFMTYAMPGARPYGSTWFLRDHTFDMVEAFRLDADRALRDADDFRRLTVSDYEAERDWIRGTK